MLRRIFTVLTIGFGLAQLAHAGEISQDAPRALFADPPASSGAFGGEIQQTMIPVTEFVPGASGYSYQTVFSNHLGPLAGGTQRFFAPLGLPSGAAIEEIRLLVRDEDAVEDIIARLSFVARAVDGSADCDATFYLGQWNETSTGIDGLGTIVLQGNVPWVIRTQESNQVVPCAAPESYLWYSIWVEFHSVDQSLSGVVVRWRRTVTPAPSNATFGDVPTSHPFFQFIEALAASGITAGCGGGNFCSDNPLTRGQMAVFLAKALGLHWPI
jgi:S-layer homology domain